MNHLLIVEDDSNTLSGLMYLFNDEGYTVHGAISGAEAIAIVSKASFDLVLCDFCLPDIDGLETCLRMKALDSQLPLFLVTACYDTKVFSEAKDHGIEKVFTKPIVLEDLLETFSSYSKHNLIVNN